MNPAKSDDDRIAIMAAQAILDRGYGKPAQSIDANITPRPHHRLWEGTGTSTAPAPDPP